MRENMNGGKIEGSKFNRIKVPARSTHSGST